MILVGDSCAMVVHGHPNTLNATMDMMVLHCAAVARGCPRTMVIADMPFGSFQYSNRRDHAKCGPLRHRGQGRRGEVRGHPTNHIEKTRAIVEMGIAVVGHVGLHPQAVGALGRPESSGKIR